MKTFLLAILALTLAAPAAWAEDCPAITAKDADGTVYSYNGGMGKAFALQLSRGEPGDKSVHHIGCSGVDVKTGDVDCAIAGFSGIMHVNSNGTDSYFKITSAPDIQLTARAGQPLKCTQQPPASPPPAGAKYVAMGSSFAAGPGIGQSADTPATRCARSADNYAHQLARRHNLTLTDVSCSGATTADLLGSWNELPPELDAVDANTELVTVTIGGNDLGYLGGLSASSCRNLGTASCRALPSVPTEQDYAATETAMRRIVDEIHRRAPDARLVLVDYFTILPPRGVCAATVLTQSQADAYRAIGARLADITARIAHDTGADLIAASTLTEGHDACAADAWVNGYPRPGVPFAGTPYHPRLAAMTAIAEALDQLIWPR